jgi:hypothetical protein
MDIAPLLWLLAVDLVALLVAHWFPRTAVRRFAEMIGLPHAVAAASMLSAEQAEAKRRLGHARGIERDLDTERTHLEAKIADWRREIDKPRRAEIGLVYEVGSPQPGGYLEFMVERQTVAARTGNNVRVPDPEVWRRPRLARVWGRNGSLCLSMAQQRFGSKREFQLTPLEGDRAAESAP